MPTTVTKTIGSASRDYASVKAWVDACASTYPSGLVAADVIWKGELYNDSEFGSVAYGGDNSCIWAGTTITTDATRYLWLKCATGQSFQDHADDATLPLRYDQSKGVGFRVTGNYQEIIGAHSSGTSTTKMVVEGIQMFYDSTYSSNYYIPIQGGNLTLNGCLLQDLRTGGTICVALSDNEDDVLINCVFVSRGSSFSGTYIRGGGAIRNCTVVRPSDLGGGGEGIANNAGLYPLVKNCAVFGFTTPFAGTIASYTSGSGNNASSVASGSIPGSSNQASLTYTSQFEVTTDAARDWRAKSGGSIIANGARDQTYTADLDIIGASRSTSTPTIGAREFISGAGATLSGSAGTSGHGTSSPGISIGL
jgi:hypothetical protein